MSCRTTEALMGCLGEVVALPFAAAACLGVYCLETLHSRIGVCHGNLRDASPSGQQILSPLTDAFDVCRTVINDGRKVGEIPTLLCQKAAIQLGLINQQPR